MQRPVDRFHPIGMQMGQGLEERVPVLDLKGDLLDQPLARAGGGHVHAWRGRADDEVVVHVVKPQEGRLRTVCALGAIGDSTAQHLGVKRNERSKSDTRMPDMADTLQLDTHRFPSFTLMLPMPGAVTRANGATALCPHHARTISCRRCPSGSWK